MITPEDIRNHLRDFPNDNYLIEGEEFNDQEIGLALHLATEDFNSTPPLSRLSSKAPAMFDNVLMLGSLAQLYRGKSLHYFRNQLDYSDGGIQVAINNKGQFYDAASQRFQAEFDRKVPLIKAYINLNGAYGELHSDYSSMPLF